MSILQNIKRGVVARPQRVIIYGPEGVGKSTLASGFPSPLFVDTEAGTAHIDVNRVLVGSLAEIDSLVDELCSTKHEFKTFVLDTIDWAEGLIVDAVVAGENSPKVNSIEDFGYGKGYVLVGKRAGDFLRNLNRLMEIGMNVVFLAHSRRVKFEQPESVGTYDKYELKLTKNVAPLVKEWADALLFMNFRVVIKDGKGQGGNERVLYTSPQAPWEAKNRHNLPEVMAVDAAELSRLVFGDSASSARGSEPLGQKKAESIGEQLAFFAGVPGVIEFLVARGQLKPGQGLDDVPAEYAKRMLANSQKFIASVEGGAK